MVKPLTEEERQRMILDKSWQPERFKGRRNPYLSDAVFDEWGATQAKEKGMNLSDEQITEVFGLFHLASSEQRKDFLAHLSFLDFNERQQLYVVSWPEQNTSELPKGGKMKEASCKPECCVEEEKETCIEKTLLVLPIYNAYLRKTCYDSAQALRLTFLELQCREGRTIRWPNK